MQGVDSSDVVARNIDRLIAKGVPFGCIVVVARHTIPRIRSIYDFFAERELPFRALPLRSGPFEEHADVSTSSAEIVDALFDLFVYRMEHKIRVPVDPLDGLLQALLLHIGGIRRHLYNRRTDGDKVIIVNTDGKLYTRRDAYERPMGDLFEQQITEIKQGTRYSATLDCEDVLFESCCSSCRFLGSCNRFPIQEEDLGDVEGCSIAAPLMGRMAEYLESVGIDKRFVHEELLRALESPLTTDWPSPAPVM
jgi:sulfatase maturation enzyme AslB (radical SAM superfamily)